MWKQNDKRRMTFAGLKKTSRAKLREVMKSVSSEKQEAVLNKPVEMADVMFEEMIQSHSLVVIDRYAPWCGPYHTLPLL